MVRNWSVDICGLVIRYGPVSYTHLDVYKRQDIARELRREKISHRLKQRLDEGMVNEVRALLASGISSEDLIYYGLEYKYLTLSVLGELSFNEMFHQLEIAIHQFAKRQMTWFRGMARRGVTIHWLDACLPMEDKVEKIINLLPTKT